MGRPIKKRFFGSLAGGTLAGGEGVSLLTVNGANSYSAGTTISFAASPIGGTTAAATITFVAPADNAPGNGNVASYSITTAGTGYTSAPAVTFNKPANVVVDGFTQIAGKVFKFSSGVTSGIYAGMVANVFFTTTTLGNPTRVVSVDVASGNITMSTANTAAISSPVSFGDVGRLGAITATLIAAVTSANTIQGNAYLTTGAGGRICDIVSQRSSRRYRVTNDQGTGAVRLISATECTAANTAGGPPTAGTMTITATDSDGGTYWVTKIESRTATITPGPVATAGTQFTPNAHVRWTVNAAVASTSVKLATND
jgi:hypothetical protein